MKKSSKKRKRSPAFIIAVSLGYLLLFSAALATVYIHSLLNKVSTETISKSNDDLGISNEIVERINESEKSDDIINIALFGLDQRDLKEAGRSDAIMILSLDKAHKKIKLSSLMRDSYVNIKGYGMDKLNHAYAFGGPELAIRTINENFGLNIRDFATVNFFSLEQIINSLGGITIDVTKEEIPLINEAVKETAALQNKKPSYLSSPGPQSLNGAQAVAYTRDRTTGNGDFARSERQRRVLSAMFEKIRAQGISRYPSLVSELLPYVSTSISKIDMLKMGSDFLTSGIKTIDQERFPVDGYLEGKLIKNVYYMVFDIKAAKDQIYKYIYEDIKPQPRK